MKRNLFIVGPLLATVLLAAGQEEQEPKEPIESKEPIEPIEPIGEVRSVQSGVYTAEQADRGAALFEDVCMNCHSPDEFGDGAYIDGWSGQLAQDMIELIRSTMPEDNPGSLKRQEYVDVAAYFFRINGLPAGDAEMDVNAVKRIRIEGPYQPGGK